MSHKLHKDTIGTTAFLNMINKKETDFEWSNRNYKLDDAYSTYYRKFPIIVCVSAGWCGLSDADSWSSGETYRVHKCVNQRRVIAKESGKKDQQLYSIPVDYPVNFQLLDNKGKFGKPVPLTQLLESHKLPIQVRFDTDTSRPFYLGRFTDKMVPLDKMTITLTDIVSQRYFVTNPIYKCIMDPENIAIIPLNAEIEVNVAVGFKGQTKQDDFKAYMKVLDEVVQHINFDSFKGQKDIMMVRDKQGIPDDKSTQAQRSENIYECLEYVKLPGFSRPYEYTNIIPSTDHHYNSETRPKSTQSSAMVTELTKLMMRKEEEPPIVTSGPSIPPRSPGHITPGPPPPPPTRPKPSFKIKKDSDTKKTSEVFKVDQVAYEEITPEKTTTVSPKAQSHVPKSPVSSASSITFKNTQSDNSKLVEIGQTYGPDEAIPLEQVPRNLSPLTVEQVGHCLQQLNLGKYEKVFAENLIDGKLMMSMDPDMLGSEFKMGKIEVWRLKQFIKDGWRPKANTSSTNI